VLKIISCLQVVRLVRQDAEKKKKKKKLKLKNLNQKKNLKEPCPGEKKSFFKRQPIKKLSILFF